MANATAAIQIGGVGIEGRRFHLPVDGGTTIYEGTMVAQLTGTGMLVPATTASSGPVVGIATHDVDNSGGSDGDKRCLIETSRIYRRKNGSGGNAFSEASLIGSPAYAFDDSTVYDNSAGGTLPYAGKFMGMDPNGKVRVWIEPTKLAGDDAEFDGGIATDTISEFTAAAGVTIDGVLLKDSTVKTDTIVEKTAAAGVTADGVLLKDGGIVLADGAAIEADIVAEATAAAGVTVDGLLVKDAGLPSFLIGVTKVQLISGTFVAGECVINAGIIVTAASRAVIVASAAITGSVNVGCLAHIIASNVVGGAGVGAITLRVLGDDGAVDADAAGTFHGWLYN